MDVWYALACVAVPCAIGGAMFLAFDRWDRWRRRHRPDGAELPVIDYSI